MKNLLLTILMSFFSFFIIFISAYLVSDYIGYYYQGGLGHGCILFTTKMDTHILYKRLDSIAKIEYKSMDFIKEIRDDTIITNNERIIIKNYDTIPFIINGHKYSDRMRGLYTIKLLIRNPYPNPPSSIKVYSNGLCTCKIILLECRQSENKILLQRSDDNINSLAWQKSFLKIFENNYLKKICSYKRHVLFNSIWFTSDWFKFNFTEFFFISFGSLFLVIIVSSIVFITYLLLHLFLIKHFH